jgi:hypothetical protein
MGTKAFDGGDVAVWEGGGGGLLIVSYMSFKVTSMASYRDDVLNAHVVSHFDNHPLADRAIFIDDNVRPHSASIIREFRQKEAIDTFQWPAMPPDINPIDHV